MAAPLPIAQLLQSPAPTTAAQLTALLLADPNSAAFGITPDTAAEAAQQRWQLLQELYPTVAQRCRALGWQTDPIELLWRLWLPLALRIATARSHLEQPLVQGILGGQGTGKTTLAAVLTLILSHLGYRVCALSLDDLYKTYADRRLLQQQDPRWRWRGPPGTHDVALGVAVLEQIRSGKPAALPRFDKSAWDGAGDRTAPEPIAAADIVLFEGWFVGVLPIDPAAFAAAPPPIHTDADRAFARECNLRLSAYLPLWQQIDRLLVLAPTDYRLSREWRKQAEQQMRAAGRGGMSDAEVEAFVEYFWRSLHPELFIQPLLRNPQVVDLAIEILPDHTPGRVYCPAAL